MNPYKFIYRTVLLLFLALIIAWLLSSCAVKKPPETARVIRDSLPAGTTIPDTWATRRTDTSLIESGWVRGFTDPQLEAIVAEALQNNLLLQAAVTRVDVASNLVTQAHSQLMPIIGVTGSAAYLGRYGQKGFLGKDKGRYNASSVLAATSWELDIWGRIRAQTAAARQALAATDADVQFARQSLAALTAKTWYMASYTNMLVKYAERNVQLKEERLLLVKAKLHVGAVQDQELNTAIADLSTASTQLSQVRSTHQQVIRALEVLLGRYPSAELRAANRLVSLPPPVPAGLPAQLLERRPDIIAAERNFDAAFHMVQSAKATRLPAISLTSAAGYMTNELFDTLRFRPWIWSVGANMAAPLYTGGFLKSQVNIANDNQRAALALYGQTVLQAFSEVEAALTNERYLREQDQELQLALKSAEEVHRLENVKYTVGQVDMEPVLQLEAAVLATKMATTEVEFQLLANRISLHLALGGDF